LGADSEYLTKVREIVQALPSLSWFFLEVIAAEPRRKVELHDEPCDSTLLSPPAELTFKSVCSSAPLPGLRQGEIERCPEERVGRSYESS
jgi:hypothetical protein